MTPDARPNALLAAGGLAALLAACLLGPSDLPWNRALAALFGGGDAADRLIVGAVRLPRALAAFAVGAALGASGAALQGLLRNPLAEPGVLGVSACSALGATFALTFGLGRLGGLGALGALALPLAAILGALAATLLIAVSASRLSSTVTLILIGVGLSSFAGAVMALFTNLAPNPFSLSDLVQWMLGSVANRSFDDLLLAAPFLAAGLALLFASRRGLSALTLGEEAAAGVGLDLWRHRRLVVTGAGLATGAAVSLAGVIGFVGIVAPHLARPLTGHDPARSLLPSALLAGLLLTVSDLLVRLLPTAVELKLGVVAALFGAPAFIWIAARRRAPEA